MFFEVILFMMSKQKLQHHIDQAMNICRINIREWRERKDPACLKEAEQWNDQLLLLGVIARYLRDHKTDLEKAEKELLKLQNENIRLRLVLNRIALSTFSSEAVKGMVAVGLSEECNIPEGYSTKECY